MEKSESRSSMAVENPDRLFTEMYTHLRSCARAAMAGSEGGHTLQPTALVHEAYLKVLGTANWKDRAHFMQAAAQAMRQVLIDYFRGKQRIKRRGIRIELDVGLFAGGTDESPLDFEALEQALARLADFDETMAKVVVMRFYGGFRMSEIAEAIGMNPRTLDRRWQTIRAWLYAELS